LAQITRIAPKQAGKVVGALYFVMAIFFCIPMGIIFSVLPHTDKSPKIPGFLFFFLPFFYGAIGFVTTAFAAAFYNWLVQYTGGLEFSVEDKANLT
jgi:hypothetical protein